MDTNFRKEALLKALCSKGEITTNCLGNQQFFRTANGAEYMVLSNEEADIQARYEIEENIGMFNYDFLRRYSKIINKIPEPIFKRIQTELCEDFNEAVFCMIPPYNFKDLIKDAIKYDGRGHFLSSWDSEELTVDTTELAKKYNNKHEVMYIYRIG